MVCAGQAPGFDPMAAWYAQHYGKMAGAQAAVPHVRNRSAQEPAADGGGQATLAGATCEAPRWWQDPKQVLPRWSWKIMHDEGDPWYPWQT